MSEFTALVMRTLKSARASAREGLFMVNDIDNINQVDGATVRSAANQLRQAAKELDEIDGMLSAKNFLQP